MTFSRQLARLLVFDLDHTLWPFGVDNFHFKPPFRREDSKVFDSENKRINCFPEVPQLLKDLKNRDLELAVASRTTYPEGAHSLIDLFEWNQYIKYREIFAGNKRNHFENLQNRSHISYTQMIFFDDEQRNIDDIEPLEVMAIKINPKIGVTRLIVEEALRLYAFKNSI